MKLISYNVNGIRAAMRRGFLEWLAAEQAEIVCLQEVKASEADAQPVIAAAVALGYHVYWYPAQKKGYSGVAVLTKAKPVSVVYGNGHTRGDAEGRVLQLAYDNFYLVNTYFPSGSSGEERQAFKMAYLADYYGFAQKLLHTHPKLIIVGDYNICHQAIDIHDPVGNKNSSGFLPEEREWLSRFWELGLIDSFRYFYTTPHHYSWWSYRAQARAKNKGWRIDYIAVSEALQSALQQACILPEVCHSDHCPVGVVLKDI